MIGQLEQCPENARLLIFQRLDPVSAADVIDAPSSGGEALIVLMPALNERCRIVVGTDFIATARLRVAAINRGVVFAPSAMSSALNTKLVTFLDSSN